MKKDTNKYPPGWNAQRVRQVIDYYDHQLDEEAAEEIAKASYVPCPPDIRLHGVTWIEVPDNMLPQIRKLLARYKKTA